MNKAEMLLFSSAGLLALALLGPCPAAASWPADPLVNVPLSTAAGDQVGPSIVSDGAGGAIVSWEDQRGGPNNTDIYVQLISADGTPQWAPDGVVLCAAAGNQSTARIASDGAGGAIVSWRDERTGITNASIYAQRISADGTVRWTADGVAVCTSTGNPYTPVIVSDGTSGAIVAWDDYRSLVSASDIYAQRISADGTPLWSADGVALCTAADDQRFPRIVTDGAGGAIVTWEDLRGGYNERDVYVRRISAEGTPLWTANGVAVCIAPGSNGNPIKYPMIVSDDAGGAIVTWDDARNGVDQDIYAQRISTDGEPLWTVNGAALCTAPGFQQYPSLASDGAGGAIVTWEDHRAIADVYAQRISAAGTALWAADGVALITAPEAAPSHSAAIVSDEAGGAIVSMLDYHNPSVTSDIYVQRISADGAIQWTTRGVAVCTAAGGQGGEGLISDGSGGAIAAWSDGRNSDGMGGAATTRRPSERSGSGIDVFAQRVQRNGELGGTVTGTILLRFEAVPFDGAIVVCWELANSDRFTTVTPERSPRETGPWTTVMGSRRENGGLTEVEDREVQPGDAPWYRLLAVSADGAQTHFGPVRPDAAMTAGLALSAPAPNPAAGPVRIEFFVASEAPVWLGVVDVSGREVAVLAEGTYRAGRYFAAWDRSARSARVPAGLYFIRYRIAERSFSKPLVIER